MTHCYSTVSNHAHVIATSDFGVDPVWASLRVGAKPLLLLSGTHPPVCDHTVKPNASDGYYANSLAFPDSLQPRRNELSMFSQSRSSPQTPRPHLPRCSQHTFEIVREERWQQEWGRVWALVGDISHWCASNTCGDVPCSCMLKLPSTIS